MYNTLKTLIPAGGYRLSDMQDKIKKMYLLGDLDERQTDELLALSAERISADAERPEAVEMVKRLSERIDTLEARLNALEGGATVPVPDEYATWEPWDGISDKYQQGSIVSHKGQLWRSIIAGQNVWEPGTAGTDALWELYSEI